MSRWFRFYDTALDDPKVQRLPAELFKVWVNILCIASRNDGLLPEVEDCAFMLRMSAEDCADAIHSLHEAGLLDLDEGASSPHNWKSRQFQSDSSTDRVKRHRNGKRNVSPTVSETPPDTETEAERTKADALDAPSASVRPGLFSEAPVYANPTDRLWGEGKTTLAAWGVPVKQAGQMIGKWLRDSGDDPPKVLEAIHAAELQRTEDPIPFVTKILQADRSRSHDVRRQDRSSTAAIDRRLAELDAGRFG